MRRTLVLLAVAAAVAVPIAAVPAADAAPVLVLGADGHVRTREDPYLPPAAPLPAPAPVDAVPRARAAAAGPSVPAELRRLQAAGTLDPATAAGYHDAYVAARDTLRRLHGYRRTQLAAVLGQVRAAAAGGRFIPSRLPALFLTLQRNRAWWAAAPIPAPGRRMTFQGSRIVWQHYPGQGLQIQWLGTFGKANALWRSGDHDPDLRRLLDEALGLATQRAGGIAFEYQFTFDGGRPPWVSGLAQGTALSALSRAAVRLSAPAYFDAARSALGIFRTPPPQGVRVDTPAGAHYLQYSYAPSQRIVNGFTQALNGLHDFAALANDDEGRALFASGEAELRTELPAFDTGAWSLYSRAATGGGGMESDLGYHELLRDFLRGLCDRLTADARRAASVGGTEASPAPDPAPYCQTATRFTDDLRTPPVLAIAPQRLRQKGSGAIRFTVDKVSWVTITIRRGSTVVLQRTARLGRGRHRIGFRPAKAGPHTITLRAVDLAGNAATATGALSVAPAAAKRRRAP
ncbi:D-glucuronyl C5-epimerase family protein [Baekduia soli]|uniref:D-glucuronyl C5-epimerase family protein n=1 Tax=Baekduia soli TaxID=496014 RepID=UPI0016523E8F|nr:D-glucuronyl C5-epimerase family protein [Baekduia soli]